MKLHEDNTTCYGRAQSRGAPRLTGGRAAPAPGPEQRQAVSAGRGLMGDAPETAAGRRLAPRPEGDAQQGLPDHQGPAADRRARESGWVEGVEAGGCPQ